MIIYSFFVFSRRFLFTSTSKTNYIANSSINCEYTFLLTNIISSRRKRQQINWICLFFLSSTLVIAYSFLLIDQKRFTVSDRRYMMKFDRQAIIAFTLLMRRKSENFRKIASISSFTSSFRWEYLSNILHVNDHYRPCLISSLNTIRQDGYNKSWKTTSISIEYFNWRTSMWNNEYSCNYTEKNHIKDFVDIGGI